MRVLGIHKNIPVSDTNLTLGLQVGFISARLADKIFPVNPRAITDPSKLGLQLEDRNTPALIINLWLIFVMHNDDLRWYMTPNQQRQMLLLNLNRVVSKPNVTLRKILCCSANCILNYLVFQINFPTDT